jgi:DNA-binding transcriptional MerR regulator
LKQTSFDFDFLSEAPKPEKKLVPPKQVMAVPQEPIEVDVRPIHTIKPKTEQKKSTRGRMKLSDMAASVEKVEIPDDEELFSKRYYGIGAVSEMFKVNISLLRFWENEFDVLQPRKTRKGDRLFRVEDIKNLQLIYFLLRQRKFSIEGAKKYIKNNKTQADIQAQLIQSLTKFKSFLLELKSNVSVSH